MGLEVERFVALGELQDDLSCVICHNIFSEPVITPCGHGFCKQCILRWFEVERSCPTCRKGVYKLCKPPIFVSKILGRQRLECCYKDKGCQEVLTIDALSIHQENCSKRPYEYSIKRWAKSFFSGFRTTIVAPFDYSVNEYDGDRVLEQPQTHRLARSRTTNVSRSIANQESDRRMIIIKILLIGGLFALSVLSAKLFFWFCQLAGTAFDSLWTWFGLLGLDTVHETAHRLAIMLFAIAAGLIFLFFTSTCMALHNLNLLNTEREMATS